MLDIIAFHLPCLVDHDLLKIAHILLHDMIVQLR